jgi:hypothetical protein
VRSTLIFFHHEKNLGCNVDFLTATEEPNARPAQWLGCCAM